MTIRKLLGIAWVAAALTIAAPVSSDESFPHLVLDQSQMALRDRIAADGPDLDAFYAMRGYLPLWTADRVDALATSMSEAPDHALPLDHDAIALLIGPGETGTADREVLVSSIYVDFARALNSGLLDPASIDSEIAVRPSVARPADLLARMADGDDPQATLRGLAPEDPQYARLMEERQRLLPVADRGWGPRVDSSRVLRPGRSYPEVPALRARLTAMGYGDLGDSASYDEELIAAVKVFQDRHGLNADGVAGPATLRALNVEPEERLGQIAINLERLRWLNKPKGARHIVVNIADATMRVIDEGQTTFTSRVVVGEAKQDFRTPEFNHEMTHMVVNPYWHVPPSIAGREYLPMLKRDPMALAKRGLVLLNRSGQVLNPAAIDFSQFTERNFPFLIKQPPGDANALGNVKFMFPNRYNIYLHDTPAKSLFAKDWRAFSHGCVRVQRPEELAYHLLARQSGDPVATFRRYLASDRERYVGLEAPVPIYLTYATAWVSDDGVPHYRGDIYGRDRSVLAALRAAGVELTHLDG